MRKLAPLLLLLVACSRPETAVEQKEAAKPVVNPPSVAEAREMIASSAELGEFEFTNAAISLPVDGALRNETTETCVRELREAGWIGVDGSRRLVLTDRSRDDRRFLLRANGLLDIVPLAKKEMGDVSAVTRNADGTSSAPFQWRWLPNDVASTLTACRAAAVLSGGQNATATFIWDGTSWSILKIERAPSTGQ